MEDNVRDFYFKNMLFILNKNTRIARDARMLEVGVGTGILAQKMASYFTNCKIKGIDLSEEHIKIARDKGLDVEVADLIDINTLEKYDLIYGSAVIHHLDDLRMAFNNMASVLNKNGVIIFGAEPLYYHFFYIFYLKIRGIWEIEKGILNLSKTRLRRLLQNDFKNIKFYHSGNMFAYLFKPIGLAWNFTRLSRIPLFNDIYIYAEKR